MVQASGDARAIPPLALGLALLALVPFLWGVLTLRLDALARFGLDHLGARFVGPHVQLYWGALMLAFMSGLLTGFAARARGPVAAAYFLAAAVPALWAFALVGGGPVAAALNLMAGFAVLLGIDWVFWNRGLAPRWWLGLRFGQTAAIVACLAVAAL